MDGCRGYFEKKRNGQARKFLRTAGTEGWAFIINSFLFGGIMSVRNLLFILPFLEELLSLPCYLHLDVLQPL